MTIEITRSRLIRLCKSLSPPYGGDEYSEYCGNQWNESWKWIDGIFSTMSTKQLEDFYLEREENDFN